MDAVRPATCHNDKPHYSLGLCIRCYARQRRDRQRGHVARKRSKFEVKTECHPDRPHFARNLCRACYMAKYKRSWRRGLEFGESEPQTLSERFWSKVNKTRPSSCWLWTGPTDAGRSKEYGRIKVEGRKIPVHRLAWVLTHGEIPSGLIIRHTCDETKCCNPTHLRLSTQQENIQDMYSKGRGKRKAPAPCHPERLHYAKGLCAQCYEKQRERTP